MAVLLSLQFAGAVPANPRPYKYTQPDGSVIVLRNHGDEFFHWTTNEAGQTVEKGSDGFYRPVSETQFAESAKAARISNEVNNARWGSYENPFPNSNGDIKVLCILANFTDRTFFASPEDTRQHFHDMLNKPGYDYDGATGSVRDYYLDNSWNGTESLFRPSFDVFGPVTVSYPSSHYVTDSNNHTHAYEAVLEAYDQLKDQIDIGQYDSDNDGAVDMVLFYYPGYSPAEGGSSDSVWPHQSNGDLGYLGEKKFTRFFCTAELRGNEGYEYAGIGNTCHEFAHSLGLPDFYDTDSGTNGSTTTYAEYLDLMGEGNYNDKGRRPPYLTAIERNMLGWIGYPEALSEGGTYSLEAVQNNKAYRLDTPEDGEFFLLESRNGHKWDAGLPSGLVVFHVDKSTRRIVGGDQTAFQIWDSTNLINAYGGHPCFYAVPNTDYPSDTVDDFVFPGRENVRILIPLSWDGDQVCHISNIAHNGTASSFTVTFPANHMVYGYVRTQTGKPVAGATVYLTPSIGEFTAAPASPEAVASTTTDASGYYALESAGTVYQILSVSKPGFVTASENITFSTAILSKDFTLFQLGELPCGELCKYDSSLDIVTLGLRQSELGAGNRFEAEELESIGAVGSKFLTVSFMGNIAKEQVGKVYVLIDIEEGESLRKDVTACYISGQFVTVDVSDDDIVIPEGKAVLIGYGFTELPLGIYPFFSFGPTSDKNGCAAILDFMSTTDWGFFSFGTDDDPVYFCIAVSATIDRTKTVEFPDLGVSCIKLGDGDVPTVAVGAGKSLKSVTWTLDGVSVAEPPATTTLAAGQHTYMARLTFYDGTSERVYYDVVR